MHEVGLMTQTLDLAASLARAQGATTIHRVVLRVGALAAVDADALRFAFDVAAAGSMADGAVLEIDEVPARCACSRCHREFEPPGPIWKCPDCGEAASRLSQGDELELATVEMS